MSELMATISTGCMNVNFRKDDGTHCKNYIMLNEWDDFELSGEINYDKNLLKNNERIYDPDYEIIEISQNNKSEYCIENGPYLISDLTIKIKRSAIGDHVNLIDFFNKISIILNLGIDCIKFSLLDNLMLCKLMGKTIKEYDDTIELPLILFNLGKPHPLVGSKIPVFLLKYHAITLQFLSRESSLRPIGIHLCYQRYKLLPDINLKIPNQNLSELLLDIDHEIPNLDLFYLQFQEDKFFNNLDNKYRINFNHQTKILFIQLEKTGYDSDLFFDQIRRVKLYLNGMDPIIWDDQDGQIMKFRIYGNSFYAISLSPEFKSKKSIHKLFTAEENGYGINFSRIDRTDLELEFYTNIQPDMVTISALNINILGFYSGMLGFRYSN